MRTIEDIALPQGQAAFLRVLCHPLRVGLLTALASDRIASPSELADELLLPLQDAAYHMRVLYRTGFLELVDERTSRSGRPPAKYYRRANTDAEISAALDEIWVALVGSRSRAAAGGAVAT